MQSEEELRAEEKCWPVPRAQLTLATTALHEASQEGVQGSAHFWGLVVAMYTGVHGGGGSSFIVALVPITKLTKKEKETKCSFAQMARFIFNKMCISTHICSKQIKPYRWHQTSSALLVVISTEI